MLAHMYPLQNMKKLRDGREKTDTATHFFLKYWVNFIPFLRFYLTIRQHMHSPHHDAYIQHIAAAQACLEQLLTSRSGISSE
ncbi:MAG: hypothetical protein J6K46_03285 [Sutterella sp.]|nr:hypothetical protein [Sutterella sp.]